MSDAADVSSRIDIRTAGGEVVSLDPPDNRLPDAGPLPDLRIGQLDRSRS
jgi:hypothetical protein